LRFCQRFLRVPVLHRLFCKLGNRIILGQDKRLVLTQQPKKTALDMGEKLFQADRPIVAFRQRRDQLLNEANGVAKATMAAPFAVRPARSPKASGQDRPMLGLPTLTGGR
jgi:hypothetical protein